MIEPNKCHIGVSEKELRDFSLNFENKITKPLLDAGLDRYNIFDILNISRQELRHSDFLAFLFDCNKSGEIGRQFLRNFLVVLASECSKADLNFFEMLYSNIDNVCVMRE
ncbi:MAG: PD-(D/E)XK nuclease family protein, partial [Clostridia bacterium]|nr:PD-(D/E)XK nuclease family protein [Clostridia bacterium]